MHLAEGIWMVEHLRASHVYILRSVDGIVIVDTGTRGSHDTIMKSLYQAADTPADVQAIVITHAHPDHIGSLPELQQITHAPIYASVGETASIEGRAPLPHPPGLYGQLFRGVAGLMRPAPVSVQHTLKLGANLPFLPNWHVMATPGHTPDHVSLYQPQLQFLIAGDALANLGGLRVSLRAVTSQPHTARATVAQLAGLPLRSIAFGHGPPIVNETTLNEQLMELARSSRYR